MNDLPTIPERVEKGIAWLEEQGAYDWAEKIVAAVDAAEFNMASCRRCAVGQALGMWSDYFSEPDDPQDDLLTWGDAIRLGTAVAVVGGLQDWEPLEREWERKAREHAAYRAEILP